MKLSRFTDSTAFRERGAPPAPDMPAVAADTAGGLSVLFTILCIVDLFGVFPVISLPNSVIACGLYGIPLVLIVFTLQLYTAMLLGRSWLLAKAISPHIQEKNRSPYAAVAELTFGRGMGGLVTFFIDSTVFAASVPNFIVASQSMQLFWWKITGGDVAVSYCLWMVVIGLLLCPVMWLGSPKDMKPLAFISVLIVLTVAVSTWSCILTDTVSPPSAGDLLHYKPKIQDLITAYGIIAFQFDIHPMLLTIQVDMKDSRRVNAAVMGGFAVTCSIFAVTCALAGYRYGTNVTPNILWGIPPSFPLYMVALLVTLQLCLSSAVGNSALFQHIEDLLRIPRVFCLKRCLLRSGIVALAVFLGEAIPKFEVIMGLVGSTLTGPLMFVFPPLFFLKLCYMKLRNQSVNDVEENEGKQDGGMSKLAFVHTDALNVNYRTFSDNERLICDDGPEQKVMWYELLLATLVVIIGVTATATAIFSSWTDFVHSFDFSTPCLVNATAAARVFIYSSI